MGFRAWAVNSGSAMRPLVWYCGVSSGTWVCEETIRHLWHVPCRAPQLDVQRTRQLLRTDIASGPLDNDDNVQYTSLLLAQLTQQNGEDL